MSVAAFLLRLYLGFTFLSLSHGKTGAMNVPKKTRPAKRQTKAAARRLLKAVDRLIEAANQAKRARDELARDKEGQR